VVVLTLQPNCPLIHNHENERVLNMLYHDTDTDNRFYLACPYAEKDDCKSLGGRWDPERKKWYVPNDIDRNLFERWWIN